MYYSYLNVIWNLIKIWVRYYVQGKYYLDYVHYIAIFDDELEQTLNFNQRRHL